MRALLARASRVVSARTAKSPLIEPLESRQLLSTYYVSPGGSDAFIVILREARDLVSAQRLSAD